MVELNNHQISRLRLRANGLGCKGGDSPLTPQEILKEVFAVQAQELPAARLSIRARSRGITVPDIERAQLEERSILHTWLLRGTLHLATTTDAAWLLPLLGPGLIAGSRRRLAELGWDETRIEAGLRMLQEALSEQPELTREEIICRLHAAGLPYEGQATVHLLYRAAVEGLICIGPERMKKPTYVPRGNWAGPLSPWPRPQALAVLARRYLQAYAPAGPKDLAVWSGLSIGEARQAWDLIADNLAEVHTGGDSMWMLKDQLPWLDTIDSTEPVVRLLPRFDTYLLGYANRVRAISSGYAKRIHPGGGIIHPSLLVDGQVLAVWNTVRRRNKLEVRIEPFQDLPRTILPALEAEVADLGRFLEMDVLWSILHG